MKYNWKKNTGVFMGCQAVSLFGSALVQYAMTWHITLTTQSGVYATIAIICGFLPMLLLSPFTGVWADRYNRKRLIMLSDAFIALSTLILALIFLSGYRAIWLMFVVMSLRSIGTAVQTPCVGAMLPDLVPTEHLTRVNGLNGSLQSLIMLVSPMLSGLLLSLFPLELIFFIDVGTAMLAILLMLLFLRLPVREKAERQPSTYLYELKQGFAYVGQQHYLRNFFIFCTALYVLVAPAAFLTPLQVARTFGPEVWRLTAIEVAFSVGMTIGGLAIAAWGGLKNRVRTMGLAFIFLGLLTVLLGMPGHFYVYLAVMCAVGLALPFFNTPAMVLLQEKVDPDYIGRVFGVMTMITSSMMPLGMLIFGPLADRVAIELLLIITGIATMIIAALLLRNKTLLAAGEQPVINDEPLTMND